MLLKALIAMVVWTATCAAAQVVLIGGPDTLNAQVGLAARFYGLDVRQMSPDTQWHALSDAVRENDTRAVVIAAEALSKVDSGKLFAALRRDRRSIPLLIVFSGAGPSLTAWSNGMIAGC